MSTLSVNPSQLSGEICIPSSKSQTQRAILFASMAKNSSIIHHPLQSPDSQAMIEACRQLGATINIHANAFEIHGIDRKIIGAADVIHAQNSGIVLRFIAGIAALGTQPIVITGDHSIRHQRTVGPLIQALSQLGVKAISTRENGFAPIIIQGPLKPGKCFVDDGADSQHVSALLIAGSFLYGTLEIEVHNPGEKPWIDITLDWLKRLGVHCQNQNYQYYKVQGIGSYSGFEYAVPGDWSSAAFPLAAALVTQSKLTLKNLTMQDLQGDKKIVEILKMMGAQIEVDEEKKAVHVIPTDQLKGLTVDINDCIDTIAILAVIACFAEGETHIVNAKVARQKECDRITLIAKELRKMGASILETDDGLIIKKSTLQGTTVLSYEDHRMAMSLAVAGMGAKGETHVTQVECISKTYPHFVTDLQQVGAHIR